MIDMSTEFIKSEISNTKAIIPKKICDIIKRVTSNNKKLTIGSTVVFKFISTDKEIALSVRTKSQQAVDFKIKCLEVLTPNEEDVEFCFYADGFFKIFSNTTGDVQFAFANGTLKSIIDHSNTYNRSKCINLVATALNDQILNQLLKKEEVKQEEVKQEEVKQEEKKENEDGLLCDFQMGHMDSTYLCSFFELKNVLPTDEDFKFIIKIISSEEILFTSYWQAIKTERRMKCLINDGKNLLANSTDLKYSFVMLHTYFHCIQGAKISLRMTIDSNFTLTFNAYVDNMLKVSSKFEHFSQ